MKVNNIYIDLPILETERMLLRKIQPDDEEDIFAYASDEEVSKYTVWYSHRTMEDTRSYMNAVFDMYDRHEVSPWGIVDKASDKLIGTTGYISWDTVNSRAEVGYALSKAYWNQGYMTEAVKRVIRFGFEQMGLVRIEARCNLDNIGSARVMEKCGMTFEGILRKHIWVKGVHEDVNMYAIIRDDALDEDED